MGPQGPPARRYVSFLTGTPRRAGPPYGLPAQASKPGSAKIGAIQLELAATAAFLHVEEGLDGPEAWAETARRKAEKAQGNRLEAAKAAYRELQRLSTPTPLPAI